MKTTYSSMVIIISFLIITLLSALTTGCEIFFPQTETGINDTDIDELLDELEPRGPVENISDLWIGDRVVDKSWKWEHKLGANYTDEEPWISAQTKPVTWIVVAKEHYGPDSGVTLMTEELIGMFAFDKGEDDEWGTNNWGNSGTADEAIGIRTWLNSTGAHEDEGFYNAFSKKFRDAVLETTVPNRVWDTGKTYTTTDKVFIPSHTELGGEYVDTHETGAVFPWFEDAQDADRIAELGSLSWFYWTRSPDSDHHGIVRLVLYDGTFDADSANNGERAIRPIVNLKPDVKISETLNEDGVFEIKW